MANGRASRTAVFVCQGRAAADGRLGVGSFSDPVARQLLDESELWLVDEARSEVLPTRLHERMRVESIRACAEVMVPRTVAIDHAVCETVLRHEGPRPRQVVILGAGLDSRPWRLACLRNAEVYLVDQPASLADAVRRTHRLQQLPARLVRVAVDLSQQSLHDALADAGHDPARPTTWLWEGVIPYLTRVSVDEVAGAMGQRSCPGSALVANYQQRSAVTTLGRRLARLLARIARLDDPLRDEPWRSLWQPQELAELLRSHGFRVDTDEDLVAVSARLHLSVGQRRSLASGRVLVAHH